MKPRWLIFTGLLVLCAAVVGISKFIPAKENPNMFMGINGDPRMRLCASPNDTVISNTNVTKALNISAPLALPKGDSAIYRVAILRPENQKSFAITFNTPESKIAGQVKIAQLDKGKTTFEESDITYDQAASLVNSFKDAKIWGKAKPTLKPKNATIPAEAIVEVVTPKLSRCIITRYDDENIRELISDFEYRMSSVVKKISLDGFLPPGEKMFGKTYEKAK